jgi:L-2-hydroxyglutarate oxidase LhgO
METLDCVVIGAGVVGLAIARSLALAGREVIVIEAESGIGQGVSSRNSEVIHAGIYYPRGSLKATLCVAGKRELYAYCGERGIEHARCGKMIVAVDSEEQARLAALHERARENRVDGVDALRWLEPAELAELEPALRATRGLLSPGTGIVDSHGLMLALQADAEAAGALCAFRSPVLGGMVVDGGIVLRIGAAGAAGAAAVDAADQSTATTVRARTVVNSAGLYASRVARSIDGVPPASIPETYFAKGNYFAYTGRHGFSHLVYPIPQPGGLGVHLTLDLGGQIRFGPDVEWLTEPGFDVDPARVDAFRAAIARYWPAFDPAVLAPAYAGVRPKLVRSGQPDADFLLQSSAQHGVPGLFNLYGMESPGLTACLAIGALVAERLA